MSMPDAGRRSSVYVGTGSVREFSFAFKIFAEEQVAVYRLPAGGDAEELVSATEYSVSLEEIGGTVTFTMAPAQGDKIVIVSAIDYTQGLGLNNFGAFNPSDLTGAWDKNTALIQQVADIAKRSVQMPNTSSEKPEEFTKSLFAAQEDARQFADQAQRAASAAESAQEDARQFADQAQRAASAAESARDEILGAQSAVIADINAAGQAQVGVVQDAGQAQVDRLQAITDQTLVGYGVAGHQETWTLTADIAAGTNITLPNGMTYIPGRDHFRLSWNGLGLYKGENFSEAGTVDQPSAVFTVSFDLKTGDVLNAWTVPLGRGELGDVVTQIENLNAGLAELSRKAAFHNQ